MDHPTPDARFDANRGLVAFTLARMKYPRQDEEDVEQLALIGLWRACVGFDPDRGFTFATYAVRCMRNEIARHLNSKAGRQPGWTPRGGWIADITSLNEPIGDDGLERGHLIPVPDDTADRAEHRDACNRVLASIAALPARQRHVATESLIHGRDYATIADDLGVCTATVGILLRDARLTLAQDRAAQAA